MIREQDKIGLLVASAFVAIVVVLTFKALLSAPVARASSRVLVGVSR